MLLLYVVAILSLAIGLANLYILYRVAQRTGLLPAPKTPFKPIKHERIDGPTLGIQTRVRTGAVMGYYRPKDEPEAEPFIALHYDGNHDQKGIPADSYEIEATGKIIRGETFRGQYRIVEDVAVKLDGAKRPTHNRPTLLAKEQAPQLTPDEEQKLAEEYELVERPSP